MPNYVRVREGSTYFFTVVAYARQPILCLTESRRVLREVITEIKVSHPFEIKAWVLLPDHLHCIWELPDGDSNYSIRWGLIKAGYTKRMKDFMEVTKPSVSRLRHREGTVWQRRFWEHRIRDKDDYAAHCDYIHYNPVKHDLVNSPKDWEFSSFNKFCKEGVYPEGWGSDGCEFHEVDGGE